MHVHLPWSLFSQMQTQITLFCSMFIFRLLFNAASLSISVIITPTLLVSLPLSQMTSSSCYHIYCIQCQAAPLDQMANFLMLRTYSGLKMLISQSQLTMLPPPLPLQLLLMPPPPFTPFLVGQPQLLKAQLLVDLDMQHILSTGSPTLIILKNLFWLQDTSCNRLLGQG
jgi:hypothetical protein